MKLRGTTPLPNFFLDKRMVDLSASSIRVYLKIIRNTLGWRDENGNVKKKDWISHSQFGNVGVSSRSVTNAVEELLSQGLIRVTDDQGNSLSDPKRRKLAKRIYYAPILQTQAEIAFHNAKTDKSKPQKLRSTKEIFTKEKSKAEITQTTERITDSQRLNQIKEEQERKQLQRDGWFYT